MQGKETSIVKFLQKYQFNFFQWSKFRNNYKIAQNAFIKTFLNETEMTEYQKTDSYRLAVAIGYDYFVGPTIKIGKSKSTYNHQMSNFKLVISYSTNGVTDENYKSFFDLFLNLFNVFKETYIIKHFINYKKYYFGKGFGYGYQKYKSIWILSSNDTLKTYITNLIGSQINQWLVNFNINYYN